MACSLASAFNLDKLQVKQLYVQSKPTAEQCFDFLVSSFSDSHLSTAQHSEPRYIPSILDDGSKAFRVKEKV